MLIISCLIAVLIPAGSGDDKTFLPGVVSINDVSPDNNSSSPGDVFESNRSGQDLKHDKVNKSFESEGNSTVGDIRLYYEIYGKGKPLLLIMGLGGHILDWGWILPKKLAEGRQVITFDNRGSGRSDQPAGPYTTAQMANDTIGLLESLGVERADVFGVSMGGMIAQEIAVRHPERVNRLVLGATSPGGEAQVLAPPEVLAYLEPRLDLTLHEALWWSAPAGFPQKFIDAHPDIVERKIQANMAYPSQLSAYQAQLAAYRAFDIGDRISEIRAPTLVLTGDSDILVPPENGRILAESIPGAELHAIEGAGHLFWISHPNETFSALAGFLDDNRH
jgi:pimeloyl-ACP methyl ester carboxylesterase